MPGDPPEPNAPAPHHRIEVTRYDHAAVVVTDVDRARRFYADVLGLEEVPRPASFDFPGAWFRVGPAALGQTLHLLGGPRDEGRGRRHFCLWVADVHAAARHVAAAAFPVQWSERHKIAGVDRFFTADPDGNRVEIQGAEAPGPGAVDAAADGGDQGASEP